MTLWNAAKTFSIGNEIWKNIARSHTRGATKKKKCNIEYWSRGEFEDFGTYFKEKYGEWCSDIMVQHKKVEYKFHPTTKNVQTSTINTSPPNHLARKTISVQQTSLEGENTLNSPKMQYFTQFKDFFLSKRTYFYMNCEIFASTNQNLFMFKMDINKKQ